MLLALAIGPAFAATVLYVYDELGRLVAEIDPAAGTTLYNYDAAGNLLSVSRGDSSAFQVVAFAPTRGTAGDIVTIYGSGFVPNPAQNSVSFNGTAAAVTAANANTLVVTVPAGVTSGPISVSNANGSGVTVQPFTVVFPPIITAVSPSALARGATVRITVSGQHLSSSTAIVFSQAGLTGRVLPGGPDNELAVDLSVAGTVPVGVYPFAITNEAGTTESGDVAVEITTALLGEVVTSTRALSVHVPAAVAGAPPGNARSVSRPLSVHLPEVIAGLPTGDTMKVARALSVHLPVPGAGASSNAFGAAAPVSVHLPAVNPGLPAGDALGAAPPVSVSMP